MSISSQAARQVVQQYPQARFLLVGDGILREQIEQSLAAAGMADRFTFAGLVPPTQDS